MGETATSKSRGVFVFCSASVMTPPFALDSVMLRWCTRIMVGVFSADVALEGELDVEGPMVSKHNVLRANFRLRSEAFMLTYHGRDFTARVWPEFERLVKQFSVCHGCRAWAACLEAGTAPVPQERLHLHTYLYWLTCA